MPVSVSVPVPEYSGFDRVNTKMSPRSATIGAAFICLSAALWGLDGVVLTPRLANLQVPFVVFLLHIVPFALMQPFLFRSYRRLRKMSARGWLALALVAFTGGMLGTLAIVNALFLVNFNQLSVVVLLQKLQPIFALALAAIVLGERISARFLAAAVVALAGAYLLTFGLSAPDTTTDGVPLKAALFAVIAAAAFGSATVLGKMLLGSLNFKDATFARYGMTSVMALLYLVVAGIGLPFDTVSNANWVIVLIISVTTGSGAIFSTTSASPGYARVSRPYASSAYRLQRSCSTISSTIRYWDPGNGSAPPCSSAQFSASRWRRTDNRRNDRFPTMTNGKRYRLASGVLWDTCAGVLHRRRRPSTPSRISRSPTANSRPPERRPRHPEIAVLAPFAATARRQLDDLAGVGGLEPSATGTTFSISRATTKLPHHPSCRDMDDHSLPPSTR